MQLKTKTGLALVAMGIGVFSAWKSWVGTRRFVPLDVAMPLAAGESIAEQFTINYDGLYLIEITAEANPSVETLHCLLGVEADVVRCHGTPSPIAANWIVSAHGHELRRGSSTELHTVPVQSQQVTRVIGEFPGKAGETYDLEVTFTSDAKQLAAVNPRMRVAVASIAYTDLESAGALVFAVAFICVMFGGILLGIARHAKRPVGHV